ncbi:unnamed protein product [Schistosoma mattheei]|uniref:Uncharacterized protein n=1 Tax=Schistosoma mattheei TaxID=31246 RepID=A0AA85B2V2_9TREM|nr:unnamed protein product [Schistosoma mattheei]
MKQLYFTVLFILYGIIYSVKSTNVTILTQLQSFYYPSRTTVYHRWCNEQYPYDYCSPLFVICLTKTSLRRCIQKYEFGGSGTEYEHKKFITFHEKLNENITNPLVFTLSNWTNDLMLHAAVFNKELTVTSLMGRSSIVIDWIKTPGTNQTETWKQITFTAFDSLMELTAWVKVFSSES